LRAVDEDIQAATAGLDDTVWYEKLTFRAMFAGGGAYRVIGSDSSHFFVKVGGLSASYIQAAATLVCLILYWSWSVVSLSLMLVFLFLSIARDITRVFLVSLAWNSDLQNAPDDMRATRFESPLFDRFPPIVSHLIRECWLNVLRGSGALGQLISGLYVSHVAVNLCWGLVLVSTIAVGWLTLQFPPQKFRTDADAQDMVTPELPVASRIDPADELLRMARLQRSLGAAGRYLDELFGKHGGTRAAEDALVFVAARSVSEELSALAARKKGERYHSWGSMHWSSRNGVVESAGFSNVDAARLLLAACENAEEGAYLTAYETSLQLLARYGHTVIAPMACVRGLEWAAAEGGEVARTERGALALCKRSKAAEQKGDYKRALTYWEQVEERCYDTVAAAAQKRDRRLFASSLSRVATDKEKSGDTEGAVDAAWTIVTFYPETPSARTAAMLGSRLLRGQSSDKGKREEKAYSLYSDALAKAKKSDYRAAVATVDRMSVQYPTSFATKLARHSTMGDWKRRVQMNARSLAHSDDFDGAASLATELELIFRDAAVASDIRTLIEEKRAGKVERDQRLAHERSAAAMLDEARLLEQSGDMSQYDAMLRSIMREHGGAYQARTAQRLLERHLHGRANLFYETAEALARIGDPAGAIMIANSLMHAFPSSSLTSSIAHRKSEWASESPSAGLLAYSSLPLTKKQAVRSAVEDGLVVPVNPEDRDAVAVLEAFGEALYRCRQGRSWRDKFETTIAKSKDLFGEMEFDQLIRQGDQFVLMRPCLGSCRECKGTGYEKYGSGRRRMLRCSDCSGRGHTGTHRDTCPECRGLGRIRCPECRGSRRVRDPRARRNYTAIGGRRIDSQGYTQCRSCRAGEITCQRCRGLKSALIKDECNTCRGKGELEMYHCDECKGTGKVSTIVPYRVVHDAS